MRGARPGPDPLREALAITRRGLWVVAVFSGALSLLMLVTPLYMFQIFDRVLASGSVETLIMLSVVAGFALLVLGVLDSLRARTMVRLGAWFDRRLGGTLLRASLADALGGRGQGAQALRDLDQIRTFLNSQGVYPIMDAPWTPVFVAVIWLMHPWLGMLALASAVLLFLLALANELATRGPLREAGGVQVHTLRQVEGALRNADVINAMGMLPGVLRRFRAGNERVLLRQARASDRAADLMGLTKFVRLFVQMGVLGLGAFLVLRGQLTAGGMIAASILLGRALAPVEQAMGAWRTFVGARDSYHRLQALLARQPAPPPAIALPPPSGELAVERLVFVPEGSGRPVLKQVSFQLPAGTALGIVGPSASGKSTLCRLLVGTFPPSAGHVRLDGAEVHLWDREDFGRHVGYLPQDVELFAGSVRDNIARLGEADDEAVVEAARLAGVHEMILRLPDGYATDIGPGGAVLSGGQRQRIGLARALFGRPRLVVLDEPNANLDQEGDAALLAALRRLKEQGATVVLVAHRPNIMAHVDRLLVLRDGAVELFGPRDQVLPRIAAPRAAPQPAASAAS